MDGGNTKVEHHDVSPESSGYAEGYGTHNKENTLPSAVVQGPPQTPCASRKSRPPDYIYSPLSQNQIRIIRLKPGNFGFPLRARLEHIGLDAAEFEAISYTWGEHVLPDELDIFESGTLRITRSLHSALQHFRHKTTPRVLWVDAVCINQQDESERSSQISLMAEIYQRASRVLVWLGPSHGSDALAFATIAAFAKVPQRLLQEFPVVWETTLAFIDDHLRTMSHCECCGTPVAQHGDTTVLGLLSIGQLLQRPWFSRLWVVQEVLSADQQLVLVSSGSHCASWTHFRAASILLGAMYEAQSPRLRLVKGSEMGVTQLGGSISEMLETFEYRPDSFDPTAALELVVAVWNRSCRDPRDRILALSSLLHLNKLANIQLRYADSPGEIYRRFSLALLDGKDREDHHQPWTSFSLVGTEFTSAEPDSIVRPSWVPDWNHLTTRSLEKLGWLHDGKNYGSFQFRPCARLFSSRTMSDDPWTIQIRGRCFATIIDILPESSWPERAPAANEHFGTLDIPEVLAWYRRCREFTRVVLAKNNPGKVDEGLTALLTTNYEALDPATKYADDLEVLRGGLAQLWEGDGHSFEVAMQHFLPFLAEQPILSKDKIDRDSFLCRVRGSGREDVGWVSKSARIGDQQCVFAGAPYPFVVRQTEDGYFQLLGDAYTASFTLNQALGGAGEDVRVDYTQNEDWYRDWNSDRPEMQHLIDNLGWLSLK